MISCILFDLDGTLVDSEELCNRAFLELLPDLDLPIEEMVSRYRGRKLAPILADLEARLGRELPAGFEPDYRARVAELFETELQPVPGVPALLEAIEVPMSVASSGPPAKIRQALTVTSLDRFFGENLFSSYEVGTWKPEPGLFLHAARAMGFPPEVCAVVEDSEPGIEAAIAAGMWPFLYSPDDEVVADQEPVVFGSMGELLPLLRNVP